MMNEWNPLLPPEHRLTETAWTSIEAITHAIIRNDYPKSTSTRVVRPYEAPLLYGYLAAVHNDDTWGARAVTALNEAISSIGMYRANIGLFGGVCGLGWTLEHIGALLIAMEGAEGAEEDSGSSGTEDSGMELNAYVLDLIVGGPPRANYDLVSGLVGAGVYFIERLPHETAILGVKAVVNQLEVLSRPVGKGLAWHTAPELLPDWQRKRCPSGYYNLGVAHGIPGIIQFLTSAAVLGIATTQCAGLVEGAVDWLIAQEPPQDSYARFTAWVAPEQTSGSRLTWCYGDLGILAVLSQVVAVFPREKWNTFVRELLDRCVNWPPELSGVADAPLCHGAAGTAHIFNRLFQTSGDARCKDRAIFWLEECLLMRTPGQGVGGYSARTMPDPQGPVVWDPTPAFLDGAIGVALMLLSAVSPCEPGWDRLMALSRKPLTVNLQMT